MGELVRRTLLLIWATVNKIIHYNFDDGLRPRELAKSSLEFKENRASL